MAKIKEIQIQIPRNLEIPDYLTLDNRGIIRQILTFTSKRCRGDIKQDLSKVLKNKQQLEDVLSVIESHFGPILADERYVFSYKED